MTDTVRDTIHDPYVSTCVLLGLEYPERSNSLLVVY